MLANPTHYSSLPGRPGVNAMPQGVPQGPWNSLYRSAPGAQLPAVRYPGMHGAGLGMPVQIVGGLGESTGKKVGLSLFNVAAAMGVGAAIGLAVHGKRPVLWPALILGGVSLATTALTWNAA